MNKGNPFSIPALAVWCIALSAVSFYAGFYRGQIEVYSIIHNDKIECKLTADEFMHERVLDK